MRLKSCFDSLQMIRHRNEDMLSHYHFLPMVCTSILAQIAARWYNDKIHQNLGRSTKKCVEVGRNVLHKQSRNVFPNWSNVLYQMKGMRCRHPVRDKTHSFHFRERIAFISKNTSFDFCKIFFKNIFFMHHMNTDGLKYRAQAVSECHCPWHAVTRYVTAAPSSSRHGLFRHRTY